MVPAYGGVWHHGIVRRVYWAGYGGFAVEIIHNVKDGGVILSDWSDFQGNGIVHLHRRPSSTEQAQLVVTRAEAQLGKPYYFFAQNCEHLASFAFYGEAKSESLQAVGTMAVIGVLAFWGLSE
jgi:hypothetical protein